MSSIEHSRNVGRFALAAVALAVLAATGGCAVYDHEGARAKATDRSGAVDRQYEDVVQRPAAKRVSESDGVWVNRRSVTFREDRLPASFRLSVAIGFSAASSLRDMTTLLSRETGMRFAFAPDINDEVDKPLFNAAFASEEDLRTLLNRAATQANMSWRYNEGTVEFFRFETRVFEVAALPGSSEFSSMVSNKNSSSSGSGGASATSGQDAKFTIKSDFWSGLKDSIKAMLDGNKGTWSISETNQTVTVTATPQVLASVDSYIRSINAARERKVALSVYVYTVDVSDQNDFGASLSLAYSTLGKSLGLSFGSVTTGQGFSGVIPTGTDSRFAGSQALFSALKSIGNTSIASEATMMVKSGETMPVNRLREISYLAEVTSTTTDSGSQESLKPAVVTEGLQMTITPSIIGGSTVQLVGTIDIASVDKFDEQGNGTQKIKTPQRSTYSVPLRLDVRSGETYVFGMRQNTALATDSGLLGTQSVLTPLGGQHSSQLGRKTLVVAVTPHIVNPSK